MNDLLGMLLAAARGEPAALGALGDYLKDHAPEEDALRVLDRLSRTNVMTVRREDVDDSRLDFMGPAGGEGPAGALAFVREWQQEIADVYDLCIDADFGGPTELLLCVVEYRPLGPSPKLPSGLQHVKTHRFRLTVAEVGRHGQPVKFNVEVK